MTGVAVARLTRRLTDTPRDFLAPPEEVSVPAVVSDVVLAAGGAPLSAFPDLSERVQRLVLIASWLLADEELRVDPSATREFLLEGPLPDLAALVDPPRFVTDPDRREELARLALRALDVPPAGETAAQAADRLSTVDSVRRHEALLAARAAEERAAAVRQAMEEQRAREAAARYSQV